MARSTYPPRSTVEPDPATAPFRFPMPSSTPWGAAQIIQGRAPGVSFIHTASHGGFKLSAKRNAEIPEDFRAPDGWYEEDCEAAIVLYFLPDPVFDPHRERALKSLKSYHYRQWETYSGESVDPAESFQKRQDMHQEAHANDWCVISAYGAGSKAHCRSGYIVPEGMVLGIATLGGEYGNGYSRPAERMFLIPEEEYQERGYLSFVVDPARHREVTGI